MGSAAGGGGVGGEGVLGRVGSHRQHAVGCESGCV